MTSPEPFEVIGTPLDRPRHDEGRREARNLMTVVEVEPVEPPIELARSLTRPIGSGLTFGDAGRAGRGSRSRGGRRPSRRYAERLCSAVTREGRTRRSCGHPVTISPPEW